MRLPLGRARKAKLLEAEQPRRVYPEELEGPRPPRLRGSRWRAGRDDGSFCNGRFVNRVLVNVRVVFFPSLSS